MQTNRKKATFRKNQKIQDKRNSGEKLNIKKEIIPFLSLIVATAALFTTVFRFSFYDKPVADIQDQAMSVTYLSQLRDRQSKYPLFMDEIDNLPQDGYFDKCATQIIISNDFDNEILLKKMVLEIEDLEVNTKPILEFNILESSDGTEAYLICRNTGWGAAKNVAVTLKGEKLSTLISNEKRTIVMPLVESAESVQYKLWDMSDILVSGYEGSIEAVVECTDESGNNIEIMKGDEVSIYVYNGRFSSGGMGALSKEIYGIKIDTKKKNFKYDFDISETIAGKARLELPICFYPDKSCTFRARVNFKAVYNNKNDTTNVSTDWAEFEFRISSMDYKEIYDASKYSEDYLLQKVHSEPAGYVLITYPAVDKLEMQGLKPN